MVTKQEVMKALDKFADPEIGISVVKMGLIKSVAVKGGAVKIKMTLTTPFCPMANYLVEGVRSQAKSLKGVKNVDVELVMPDFKASKRT
jgi:metal-sulfur cluster biosynthetic enzyme